MFQTFQDFKFHAISLFFKPEELFLEVSSLLSFLSYFIVAQLYHLVADENLTQVIGAFKPHGHELNHTSFKMSGSI